MHSPISTLNILVQLPKSWICQPHAFLLSAFASRIHLSVFFSLVPQLEQAGVFAHPKASHEKSTAELNHRAVLQSVLKWSHQSPGHKNHIFLRNTKVCIIDSPAHHEMCPGTAYTHSALHIHTGYAQGKVSKSTSHLCAEQGAAVILIALSCRVRTRLWQGFLAFERQTVVEEKVVEWMSSTAQRGARGEESHSFREGKIWELLGKYEVMVINAERKEVVEGWTKSGYIAVLGLKKKSAVADSNVLLSIFWQSRDFFPLKVLLRHEHTDIY